MSRIVFPPKAASETVRLPFDFTSRLAPGISLTGTPTVAATVYSGTDASPSALISGAASITSGAIVWQAFTGGAIGVIYELDCAAGTSDGQTLHLFAFLAVPSVLPL